MVAAVCTLLARRLGEACVQSRMSRCNGNDLMADFKSELLGRRLGADQCSPGTVL